MRIPVFARGSNPAVDLPNQRKSESYGAAEVGAGRADWIDPKDHARGILCRAFLYSGEALKPVEPEQLRRFTLRNALPPIEVRGGLDSSRTQFDDPEKRLIVRQDRHCLIIRARAFARFCDVDALAQA